MAVQTLISPEEFLALPDQEEYILEYDEGLVLEAPETDFEHGVIQGKIFRRVSEWSDVARAGVRVSQNAGFWLTDDKLRKPDVSIIRQEDLAALPRYKGGLRGCPEIAVEVISDTERVSDIEAKAKLYLATGARAVWKVYPQSRTVVVQLRSGHVRLLAPGDFLEDAELLPGLRIPVAERFD